MIELDKMIISYQLLLFLLSPVFLILSIKHVSRHKDSMFLWQRLGMKIPDIKKPIWFHCASVGEVVTIVPLVQLYNKKYPDQQILVTTNTVTGGNTCKKMLPFVTHSYLPFDYRSITKKFLRNTNPSKLIVMETELWPNLFQLCHSNKIPLNIINARLSSKSLNINAWSKSIYRKTLSYVDKIYCRSDEDSKSYLSLGALESQAEVLGNLKFSVSLKTDNCENLINRPYVLAASTHANEEKEIVKIWNNTDHGNLLLVIAPRHPERKDEILKDISTLTKEIKTRSELQEITENTDLYLADTLGELTALFQHAEIVIMGGSFTQKGGHNILEPAAFSKAIIYGNSMENFSAEDILFRKNNAALQAKNSEQAIEYINKLIADTEYRERLGHYARELIEENNGIAKTYLDNIS